MGISLAKLVEQMQSAEGKKDCISNNDFWIKLKEKQANEYIKKPLAEFMDYYINIHFSIGQLSEYNGSFIDYAEDKIARGGNEIIILAGEAGTGKTFLLSKLYLHLANKSIEYMPVFIDFNNSDKVSLKKDELLSSLAKRYNLAPSNSVLKNSEKKKIIFIIDSLDEVDPSVSIRDIQQAFVNRDTDSIFFVAVRKNFYQKMYDRTISDCIESRINLLPLDEKEIIDYSNKILATNTAISKQNREKILEYVKRNKFFSNILLLTWYLMCAHENNGNINTDEANQAIITKLFVDNMLSREQDKTNASLNKNNFYEIMQNISWKIYKNRKFVLQKENFLKLKNTQMIQFANSELERYIDLFIYEKTHSNEFTFLHEYFLDFFVAKKISEAISKNFILDEYLDIRLKNEINLLMTSFFETYDKAEVFANLKQKYVKTDVTHERKIILMHHMYRTKLTSKIAEFIREHIVENKTDMLEQMTRMHTLSIVGAWEDEEAYFYLIKNNDKCNRLARGSALIYYSEGIYDEKLPYEDDGTFSWEKCFEAYKMHIENDNNPRYYRIKRANLLVAKCFIQKRNKVDSEVAAFYRSIQSKMSEDKTEYGRKCYDEYLELIETISEVQA